MINAQFKFEGLDLIKNSSIYFYKIFKFEGQFNIDGQGQGQGHQFSNSSETCRSVFKLKLMSKMVQKLSHSQGITQTFKLL